MPENELPPAGQVSLTPLDEISSGLAPVIFAEETPSFGVRDGVGNFTLETIRHHVAADGTITAHRVVAAHVRMPLRSVVALREALNGILLQAAPPASDSSN